MKKWLFSIAIPILLIVAGFAAIHFRGGVAPLPKPQDGMAQTPAGQTEGTETVAFDLHYRGLTAPDDALSYRAYWGFGASPPTDVPFVEAVKKQVQEFDLVHNAILPDRQWSVVELKDKKPVALYFDVDGDGTLSENEKILPAASSKAAPDHEFAFITPDFMIRRKTELVPASSTKSPPAPEPAFISPDATTPQEVYREIPFRVMLVANAYGGDQMNYMWSPCCILEAEASLAGQPRRMLLYGNGFSGFFNVFGSCSFILVPAGQKLEEYPSRNTLSSLICHDKVFYRLRLDGTHEKDKTLRATLQKDTSPTGRMAADVKGTEGLKARLTQATITGGEDASICFDLPDVQSAIPAGGYKLSSGTLGYGAQSDDQWQVNFAGGPRFSIDADKTSQVEVGTPALSVSAIDEQERYSSDAKEKSTYAKGTPIYLTPQIKGRAGESYLRFSQKNAGGDDWTDVKPRITILAADGKEVASADMEYG